MQPPLRRRAPNCLADYLGIARRRWAWAVLPFLAVGVTGGLIVRRMPRLYLSQALILVEGQKVPSDFVKPTVSSDINDLLSSISQTILSRTSLWGIIQKYGLYQELRGRRTEMELVQRMRDDIQGPTLAKLSQTDTGTGPDRDGGAFTIAYEGRSPQEAQEVTQELANLFIEENLRVRQQHAQGTEDFIDVELDKARATLQGQSAKLEALKSQYMGSLPEQQASNLQQLGQEQAALQAAEGAVARDQQQRTYLQSLLAALASPAAETAAPTSPLANQLQADEAKLATLEQIDTPEYPDVKRLKAEISALKQQIAATAQASPVAPGPNGLSQQQIKGELATLDQDAAWQARQQRAIEAKIHELERRVEMEPAVEARLNSVQRDFDIAKLNYESLLQKKNAAAIAAAMEQQAEGEEFRIIDPANLPSRPDKPSYLKLGVAILLAAVVAGAGAAAAREFADPSLRNERDVAYYLGVPLLATFPKVLSRAEQAQLRRRRVTLALASLGFAVLAAGGGVAWYLHSAGALGWRF